MPIAALPDYLGKQDFKTASPGMRFGMYLSIWTDRQDLEREVKKRAGKGSREGREVKAFLEKNGMDTTIAWLQRRDRNPLPRLWDKNTFAARDAWLRVIHLQEHEATLRALLDRQRALSALNDDALVIHAQATAPFTTGLGNEHPLENGFAFLWPYGLPYLPGSGVKGVLRQAARELLSGEWGESEWRDETVAQIEIDKKPVPLTTLDLLFGLESEDGAKEHFRGVLSFWDVIPEIRGNALMVEIMTPHQKHYYQDGEPPHDCGQPNPIAFLTVPPGSTFNFHVQCDLPRLQRLAPSLAEDDRWKTLLRAAFEHAFDWLGFGAKTAVGYGAMQRSDTRTASPPHSTTGPARETDTPLRAEEAVWEDAVLVLDPGRGELTAQHGGRKTAPLKGQAAEALRASLSEEQRRRLKKKKSLKGVKVRVRVLGNQIELAGLVS